MPFQDPSLPDKPLRDPKKHSMIPYKRLWSQVPLDCDAHRQRRMSDAHLAVEDEVLDRLGHEDDVAHPAHDDGEVPWVKHPQPRATLGLLGLLRGWWGQGVLRLTSVQKRVPLPTSAGRALLRRE